jgi:hypothetical protein
MWHWQIRNRACKIPKRFEIGSQLTDFFTLLLNQLFNISKSAESNQNQDNDNDQ